MKYTHNSHSQLILEVLSIIITILIMIMETGIMIRYYTIRYDLMNAVLTAFIQGTAITSIN